MAGLANARLRQLFLIVTVLISTTNRDIYLITNIIKDEGVVSVGVDT